MMMKPNLSPTMPVYLCFSANTAQLASLGAFLRNNCGAYPKSILIELAVTEVVVNAIKHGRASNCQVHLEQTSRCLKAEIWDDGLAFDLRQANPKRLGELREHGYGVGIVQEACDSLDYTFENGWNKLSLFFQPL